MINAAELGRWIPARSLRSPGSGGCRLFCFPYAGAGASVFRLWQDELPPDIQVVPVQLPGRESRWADQPPAKLTQLAETLAATLQPLLSQPYALFGHSMGAYIAFELARVLEREQLPLPRHLFVSGAPAPHIPDRERPVHHLPDVLLWKSVMRDYPANQDQAPLNAEMAPVLLPILRADFRMCESYHPAGGEPFAFPLTAFGGAHDRRVTYDDLSAWSTYTLAPFRMQLFPGGHFYWSSNRRSLLTAISNDLAGLKKTLTWAG